MILLAAHAAGRLSMWGFSAFFTPGKYILLAASNTPPPFVSAFWNPGVCTLSCSALQGPSLRGDPRVPGSSPAGPVHMFISPSALFLSIIPCSVIYLYFPPLVLFIIRFSFFFFLRFLFACQKEQEQGKRQAEGEADSPTEQGPPCRT